MAGIPVERAIIKFENPILLIIYANNELTFSAKGGTGGY